MAPSRKPRLAPIVALLACAACAPTDKEEPGTWTPGKADGLFEIVEVGPLEPGMVPVSLRGVVPAFRVESYGGTTLEIDLRGLAGADPLLVVEGPLPDNGDRAAPGAGALVGQDDDGGDKLDARLALTLAEPGVYRVIAGTYDSLALGAGPTGELELASRCTSVCARPSISQRELLTRLRDSGQLGALADQFDGELAAIIPDPALQDSLRQELDGVLSSADFEGVERFPTVPLRALGTLRPALGALDAPAPQPDKVVEGELAELLGPCQADRSPPGPLHPALPGVGNGHFPNLGLTGCQVAHSATLAQLMTSLAADNGSVVSYGGEELRTPSALIAALIASGHTVEVRNERTYANFISLTYGPVDVRWPVWLDTGVTLADGQQLVVPMGHSHHAWRIRGPLVDARVMFYLGISGAAFFAQTSTRPAWTGEIAFGGERSDAGGTDMILATVDAAAAYLRRNRVERTTVAAGMPADGYGFVGVCNDSNATIEYLTRGTITTFPLLRAASLDQAPELGDGLDDVVRDLPHDADVAPPRADALRRVLAMTPHPLDSPLLLDEVLRAQLAEARAELGK